MWTNRYPDTKPKSDWACSKPTSYQALMDMENISTSANDVLFVNGLKHTAEVSPLCCYFG